MGINVGFEAEHGKLTRGKRKLLDSPVIIIECNICKKKREIYSKKYKCNRTAVNIYIYTIQYNRIYINNNTESCESVHASAGGPVTLSLFYPCWFAPGGLAFPLQAPFQPHLNLNTLKVRNILAPAYNCLAGTCSS